MQDVEFFPFLAIFRSLLQLFPKRLDEHEIQTLAKAYFTALRYFTIPQLQAGADAWIQRGKFFPKPAEWREAIPRAHAEAITVTELTADDAAVFINAEANGYAGTPCTYPCCRGAIPRFVPDSDSAGTDAKARMGTRLVTRGHWAHGDELRDFYAARDRFWTDFRALLGQRVMVSDIDDSMAANPEDDA